MYVQCKLSSPSLVIRKRAVYIGLVLHNMTVDQYMSCRVTISFGKIRIVPMHILLDIGERDKSPAMTILTLQSDK